MSLVEKLYEDFRGASDIIGRSHELSIKISVDDHFRKNLLLSAASYFEHRLSREVENFTQEITGNDLLLCSLVKSKAVSRQYHSWFDWKVNNANTFFSLFGNEFRDHMRSRVADDEILSASIRDFMEIGRERNLLVHSDYASYPLNKTSEEIFKLYQSALNFVDAIGSELRACSTAMRERQRANDVA